MIETQIARKIAMRHPFDTETIGKIALGRFAVELHKGQIKRRMERVRNRERRRK